jgi:hypothetical protein
MNKRELVLFLTYLFGRAIQNRHNNGDFCFLALNLDMSGGLGPGSSASLNLGPLGSSGHLSSLRRLVGKRLVDDARRRVEVELLPVRNAKWRRRVSCTPAFNHLFAHSDVQGGPHFENSAKIWRQIIRS